MRKFFIVILSLVFVILLSAFAAKHLADQAWHLQRSSQASHLEVAQGDSFYRSIDKAFGNREDNWWLKLWFKLHPELSVVKVGYYALPEQLSYAQLAEVQRSGQEIQLKLSLIEGDSFKQFWAQLNQAEGIIPSDKSEQELLDWLGSEHTKLEGLLLPETYFYAYNTTSEEIVKRAYHALELKLLQHWEQRTDNLPLATPYEALILASIIEKETGAKHERPLIASVFVNRLNKKMRLQTDPTVIYGMGERYQGNIRRKDLREATAYNTYVIPALPPTPIAMASEDAIRAALNPEQSDRIYFVAKGGGEHYFSKTYAEHQRAVRKYILKK